ncbi:hypothetical protein [Muricoccus roseus]|nr:hypothetical protein [Roseomonas rosea]
MGLREDILILGLTAGVVGSLVGGLMLGIGLGMVTQGAHAGWVLVLPSAPVAGLIGLWLARRLVRRQEIGGQG